MQKMKLEHIQDFNVVKEHQNISSQISMQTLKYAKNYAQFED